MEEKINNSAIAVVIATLNEAEGIGPTLEDLRGCIHACKPHFLVVDGNSVDKTVEIAKNMGADVILQEGKGGKGHAICQGVKQLNSDVQYVVFIDADFTYPAEYILKMIEIMGQNPDVGMVIGNRFNSRFKLKDAITDLFYFGNRFLSFAQYLVNGVKLRDPLSGLRVVRFEVLKGWKPKSEGFDVEAEMNYHVEREGYRIVEIPIRYRQRLGDKKLKFRDGFIILKRILAESLS